MAEIWKNTPTIAMLNQVNKGTMCEHLDLEFTEVGDDYLIAKLPVDKRTIQPMGLLHGGANVVLAETLGSVASFCCVDISKQSVVGLEVNANHLRSAKAGFVYGKVTPIRIGRTVHVWQIDINDEEGRLTCVSRITIAIIDRKE